MKALLVLFVCIGIVCADVSTVRFLLWTRSNPGDDDYFDLLWLDDDSLAASPFDGTKRTHFGFHGWGGNGFNSFLRFAKDDLLVAEDINFISVDWEELGGNPIYEPSAENVYDVGNHTAQLIDYLVQSTALTTADIHAWGYSLGGHCAGMTGHYVESGIIDRVTALDPAGPSFYGEDADRRVDSTSAAYVDVIHTNGGTLAEIGTLGLEEAVGHADFYPNGGSLQPGCSALNSGCSHGRAPDFFVESITSPGSFVAYPCDSWESFEAGLCDDCADQCDVMGYHSESQTHGIYFLRTNAEPPYAIET